jgi:hypothetical protein
MVLASGRALYPELSRQTQIGVWNVLRRDIVLLVTEWVCLGLLRGLLVEGGRSPAEQLGPAADLTSLKTEVFSR